MSSLHCPACGQPLHVAPCADPRAICLACTQDHRYFVQPEGPLVQESATAAAAEFSELNGKPLAEVASFWLSDPRARSILNEQLAELLRTILDGRTAEAEHDPSYCPICRGRYRMTSHQTIGYGPCVARVATNGITATEHFGLFAGVNALAAMSQPRLSFTKR